VEDKLSSYSLLKIFVPDDSRFDLQEVTRAATVSLRDLLAFEGNDAIGVSVFLSAPVGDEKFGEDNTYAHFTAVGFSGGGHAIYNSAFPPGCRDDPKEEQAFIYVGGLASSRPGSFAVALAVAIGLASLGEAAEIEEWEGQLCRNEREACSVQSLKAIRSSGACLDDCLAGLRDCFPISG
jgi:hypothetical protein